MKLSLSRSVWFFGSGRGGSCGDPVMTVGARDPQRPLLTASQTGQNHREKAQFQESIEVLWMFQNHCESSPAFQSDRNFPGVTARMDAPAYPLVCAWSSLESSLSPGSLQSAVAKHTVMRYRTSPDEMPLFIPSPLRSRRMENHRTS